MGVYLSRNCDRKQHDSYFVNEVLLPCICHFKHCALLRKLPVCKYRLRSSQTTSIKYSDSKWVITYSFFAYMVHSLYLRFEWTFLRRLNKFKKLLNGNFQRQSYIQLKILPRVAVADLCVNFPNCCFYICTWSASTVSYGFKTQSKCIHRSKTCCCCCCCCCKTRSLFGSNYMRKSYP